jgi:hypothetical protein
MISRPVVFIPLLLATLLVSLPRFVFAAQDGLVVSPQPDPSVPFSSALRAISDQSKVTFVIEGFPIKSALPTGDADKTKGDLSVEEAVNRIAREYDYTVVPPLRNGDREKRIFVLKKRYSSPYDLPGVTLEEYVLAMNDISRVLKAHLPQPAWTTNLDFARTFLRTLSSEQKQILEKGERLPVSSLSPVLQTQVRRLNLNSHTGSLNQGLINSAAVLDPTMKATVVKKVTESQAILGYDYYEAAYERTVFRRLNGITIKGQFNADSNTPRPGDSLPAPDAKGVT